MPIGAKCTYVKESSFIVCNVVIFAQSIMEILCNRINFGLYPIPTKIHNKDLHMYNATMW